jgi:hypothetical protein
MEEFGSITKVNYGVSIADLKLKDGLNYEKVRIHAEGEEVGEGENEDSVQDHPQDPAPKSQCYPVDYHYYECCLGMSRGVSFVGTQAQAPAGLRSVPLSASQRA